ncbi:apolipophorins [Trichonephila clavata]|uniref:Apolipophorins n=1 Tax=Trichonephila clavata TaxID=2740835 RepID=A0A8X6FAB9_TRICU|nr:apolipophorins [Trichonephila clavata]
MGLKLFLLVCMVGAAFAGPLYKDLKGQCAKSCKYSSIKKFELNSVKVYDYESKNTVIYGDNQTQTASIEGRVEFHPVSECEILMKVTNIKFDKKLPKEEHIKLKKEIELTILFEFSDGEVKRICAGPEESTQSLNIKRGVISSIINTMNHLNQDEIKYEWDSLGRCLTNYTSLGSNFVRKTKDLKTCEGRHQPLTYLWKDKMTSSWLMNDENLACVQIFKDKFIERVECIERGIMKTPLKDSKNLVEFLGEIRLQRVHKEVTQNVQIKMPLSQEELLYGIEESRKGDNIEKRVENMLRKMCVKNTVTVDNSASTDFMTLFPLMKGMTFEQMNRIYESMKNGRLCPAKKVRDMFVDILPYIGNHHSVKLMVKLIKDEEITGIKKKLWLTSFALISKPTPETVDAIIPLLKTEYSAPLLLSVSAMIHKLCTSKVCAKLSSVNEVVSILEALLGDKCSSEETEKIIGALKAYGNMGYHGAAHENILACVSDSSKPIRVRLAAIDSFRRIKSKRPDKFVDLVSNKNENSEITIALLSSLFNQPDEKQLRVLKEVLEKLEDENVSGYVYTYIRNVNKTSSPRKQKIKEMMKHLKIHAKNVTYWENSKNIEFSTFSKLLNVGASTESDIIHSEGMPHSIYSRFDADIFDKSVNIAQVGLRVEGLEKILKNFIGLKNKVPKVPSASSWNFLSSKDILGESDAEVSFYLRMFEDEILGFSASDLSGIGEMIQIADIMNKLARGRNYDASHSFIFLNSRLVIPSVTGRSYSIDLTGSSTLGLTAKSKIDVKDFPRKSDVDVLAQFSMSTEISALAGIRSKTHGAKGVKVVSRAYTELNIGVKAEIKDGHIALVKLNLPSENISSIKISNDIFEIDSNNTEKRLFDKMQTKIDRCIDYLEKPLGISACLKCTVPKPWVRRSSLLLLPIGSTEISLRKTDNSFNSYVVRLEIPKHKGTIMKYKASFDTDGSSRSRRFAGDLEIKQQTGSREFSLKLESPFKNISGRGECTMNENYIHGSLELHEDSKQKFKIYINSRRTSFGSTKSYQNNGGLHYLDYEPLLWMGNVNVTEGRKHFISYDFSVNKPSSKSKSLDSQKSRSTTVKGTLATEGNFGISKKSEWKLSWYSSISSPFGEFKIRKTVEKRSKKYQSISLRLGVDYQVTGRRNDSIALSWTYQRNLDKCNINGKFEMAKNPNANLYFTWDKQGSLKHNLKNNITLKYGRNPENTYIHVTHSSKVDTSGTRECTISLENTRTNIKYDLKLKHYLEWSQTPKLLVDANLCYGEDKHAKIYLDVNYISKSPLKAKSKLEIEYLGEHIILEDEVFEPRKNVIEGRSHLRCTPRFKFQEVEFKYIYQKLSNEFKFHHKIESSLKTPSTPNPIKSIASIELSKESLVIVGEIGSKYSATAQLNRAGISHITLKTPEVEGSLKSKNEDLKKAVDIDLKLKEHPQHIKISFLADLEEKKNLKLSIIPDVDRLPEWKIYLSTVVEVSKRGSGYIYTSSSKVQVLDYVDISLAESGDILIYGKQDCALDISIKNCPPVSLVHKQEISEGKIITSLIYSRNHVEKAKIELEGNFEHDHYKRNISAKVSITSLDHSFEDTHLQVALKISGSGRSTRVKSLISFQRSSKVYRAELNSDLQPDGINVKAEMNTPVPNYEKQTLGVSLKLLNNDILLSVNYECLDNKKISITANIKRKSHGFSINCAIHTFYDNVRDVEAHLAIHKHSTINKLEGHIEVNNEKVVELEISNNLHKNIIEIEGKLKIPKVELQKFHALYQTTDVSALISGKIELAGNHEFSVTAQVTADPKKSLATASIITPFESYKDAKVYVSLEKKDDHRTSFLFYHDRNGKRKTDVELTCVSTPSLIEIQGRMKTIDKPEISAHVKFENRDELFMISAKIMKGALPLLSTSLSKQSYQNMEKLSVNTESLGNVLLNLEILKNVSEPNLRKYSLKLSGEISPIFITILNDRREKNSVIIEISLCRETKRNECYSLKSYYQDMVHSGNYRFYRKVTIDFKKSSHESNVKALGSVHALLILGEYDHRSKVTLQLNEKTIGYDLKYHHRRNENDPCTFDTHLYLLENTSRVKGSVLHNDHEIDLEIRVIPDTEHPTHQLIIEAKKETNLESNEQSGHLKLSHPEFDPVIFTYNLQKVGEKLVRAKLVLDYSSVWGKGVIVEIKPYLTQESSGIRTLHYKIKTKDQNFDASLKCVKKNTKEEDKIGCEWTYKYKSVEKKGEASITLCDKIRGRPTSIRIVYSSPSSDISIIGLVDPTINGVSLSYSDSKRKIQKDIRIILSGHCIKAEVSKGKKEPFLLSSACILKQEENTLHLLKFDIHYFRHKSLNIRLDLDPANPAFVDVIFEWNKEDLSRALNELVGLDAILRDLSLKDIERELEQKLENFRKEVLHPSITKLLRTYKEIKKQISKILRDIIRKNYVILNDHIQNAEIVRRSVIGFLESLIPWDYIESKIISPLNQTLMCFITDVKTDIFKHIPDITRIAVELIKAQFHYCWDKFCPRKSLCYNVGELFKSYDLRKAISETYEGTQRSAILPFSLIKDIANWVISEVSHIKEKLESIFGKFIGDAVLRSIFNFVRNVEKVIRSRIIAVLDEIFRKINHIFNEDEDYKAVKVILAEAKEKLIRKWEDRERITEDVLQSMKESVKVKVNKMVKEKFQVVKYDPEGGSIKLKVHLGSSELQILQNELRTIQRMLEQRIDV